jgi:hypothetical protein
MATIPNPLSCPLPPASWWGRLSNKLNTSWHKYALWAFAFITLAHWAEHLVQAIQVYVLHRPLPEARGLLGTPFPFLVKSEALHYGYAFVMLVLLWVLRKGFTGRSYVWWMIAFWIQFWHHVEHGLLQYQALRGPEHYFFGAPQPISLIQMLGFLGGSPGDGFGGLLFANTPASHTSWLTPFVRRVEVHLFYNTVVFVPMAIGTYLHVFPTPEEEQHMGCACSWHYKNGQPMIARAVGGA